MKYNIQFNMKLTPKELKKFKKFLSKGPYSQVGKMIAKIDEQVSTQDMNAAAATAMGDEAAKE
jgi:hypothetical protein